MRNIAMILFAGALVFTACSKEKKVNKKLDGSWTLSEENGEAIDQEEEGTTVLEFRKDGKEGAGTLTYTNTTDDVSTSAFTYTLNNNVLETDQGNYTVLTYTDAELELFSTNGTFELNQKFTRN